MQTNPFFNSWLQIFGVSQRTNLIIKIKKIIDDAHRSEPKKPGDFSPGFFFFKHLNYQYYRLDAGGETQT